MLKRIKKYPFYLFCYIFLCMISLPLAGMYESENQAEVNSNNPRYLSPFKYYRVDVEKSLNNKYFLDLSPTDPSTKIDYQWQGKTIAQLLKSEKRMLLKSEDNFDFFITDILQTGDLSIDLKGGINFLKPVYAGGTTVIRCKVLENENTLNTHAFLFNGQQILNSGSFETTNCLIEKCQTLSNKKNWTIKNDCHLKEIGFMMTGRDSSWTVGNKWIGTFDGLHLEGKCQVNGAALFEIGSSASFKGTFDSPILYAESKGTLKASPQAEFLVGRCLALKAKDLLQMEGTILDREEKSSTVFDEKIYKSLAPGIFLQSEEGNLLKYGRTEVHDKPISFCAKKHLIHDHITSIKASPEAALVMAGQHVSLIKNSALHANRIGLNAQDYFYTEGIISAELEPEITSVISTPNDLNQLVIVNAQDIFSAKSSTIAGKTVHMAAHKEIVQEGTIKSSSNIFQTAATITAYETSSITGGNVLLHGKNKLSQSGIVNAHSNLSMRANQLHNFGTIQASNAHFKGDWWWLNRGLVTITNEIRNDGVAVCNVYPGKMQTKKDITNAFLNINLLGASQSQTNQQTSVLNLNAGLKNSLSDTVEGLFNEDNLAAARECIFMIMTPAIVKAPYFALKLFLGLPATRNAINDAYQQLLELPDTYTGLSDVIPVLAQSVNTGLSTFNQFRAFGTIQTAANVPNSITSSGLHTPNPFQELGTFKTITTIAKSFAPDYCNKSLFNFDLGLNLGLNGQTSSFFNVTSGGSFFANSTTLNTYSGIDTGITCAADIAIQATDKFIATSTSHMAGKDITVEAGTLHLHNKINVFDKAVLKAHEHAAISASLKAHNDIIASAPNLDLQKECTLNSSNTALTATDTIAIAAKIESKTTQIQAKNVAFKNHSALNQSNDGLAVVKAENFVAESGSSVKAGASSSHNAETHDHIIILSKKADLQAGSRFDSNNGAIKVVAEKITDAATVTGKLIHMKANDILLKNGSATSSNGASPLIFLESHTIKTENGSKICANAEDCTSDNTSDHVVIVSKQADLQAGSLFDAGNGAIKVAAEEITHAAKVAGKLVHMQANDMVLKNESITSSSDANPLVILKSKKLKMENGAKIATRATATSNSTDDTRIILDAPELNLATGSSIDPEQGKTIILTKADPIINSSIQGQLELHADNVSFAEAPPLNLLGLEMHAKEAIQLKRPIHADKLFMQAKYIEPSNLLTTKNGLIKADRWYWSTGRTVSNDGLHIITPLLVNFKSYTQAKNLTTNSIIDLDLFSGDLTAHANRNSLIALDLSAHIPMLTKDSVLLDRLAWQIIFLAMPPEAKLALKAVLTTYSLVTNAPLIYQSIIKLAANPNATASDWVPVINQAANLAAQVAHTAVAAYKVIPPESATNNETQAQEPSLLEKTLSQHISTESLATLKGSIPIIGSLANLSSTRNSLIDFNLGQGIGANAISSNIYEFNGGKKYFINNRIETCYGINAGEIGAYNLSILAQSYRNGLSSNFAGSPIEIPGYLLGNTITIDAAAFSGSSNSVIATLPGGTFFLETSELDNTGTVHGKMHLKFNGDPAQLKNIGTINSNGQEFIYQGPLATATATNAPTADELAVGAGKWGSINNPSAIIADVGTQDIHIQEAHDVKHTLQVKTQAAIEVSKPLSSQGSLTLDAGKNLSHNALYAKGHLQRISQEGSIIAQSGIERVNNGTNYEDTAQQVVISAGKSNSAFAGQDIIQKATLTCAGKEGISLQAKGTIVDQNIVCERHTESVNAEGFIKDTTISSEVCRYNSEGGLQIHAGNQYSAKAPVFNVKGETNIIQAGQKVHIGDVHTTHMHESSQKSEGFWSSDESREKTISHQSVGAQFIGKTAFTIDSPDTTIISPQSNGSIILQGNAAQILLGENQISSLAENTYSNWIYGSNTSAPKESHTFTPHALACIENYTKILTIQSIKEKTDELLGKIKNHNDGTISQIFVEESQYADSNTHRHLSPGTKVVLGIAIGIATKGLAAPLAAKIAALGAGSNISLVLSQMSTSAINCLLTNAANTLVETNGDIIEAANQMASCQTFKNVALTAVSTGLTSGSNQLLDAWKIPSIHDATNFSQRISYAAPREIIQAGISIGLSALAQQPIHMPDLARNCSAKILHTALVSQIAQLYGNETIGSITHKILHGAAGATYGGIINGKDGAFAGALGAVTAEITAELLAPSKHLMLAIAHGENEHNGRLSQQEFMSSYALAMQEYLQKTLTAQQAAQFTAAITALATNHDAAIAHQSAVTALDNNFLVLASYGIAAASTAYSGYQIYKSYEQEGAVGALKQLGIEIAYNAAGIGIAKVGGRFYPSIKAATIAALEEAPALKLILGDLAETLIIAAEKINQTALGQAVNKVEKVLVEQEAKLLSKIGIKPSTVGQHVTEYEEVVLAGTDIRIRVEKEQLANFRTQVAQTNKKIQTNTQTPSLKSIKNTKAALEQATREIILPKVKTYEEARNKALELLEGINYQNGYPHVGSLGVGENKLAGRKWENLKVTIRLDYDPVKGPHINVTDCRLGKGQRTTKFAIPFEGNEKTVETLLKHLNTPASFEQAKLIFIQAKDDMNLGKLLQGKPK